MSNHSHMVFQFVNRQSQAWLCSVLNRETAEAQVMLRRWQEATLAAVEALQITASAVVPLHFVDNAADAPALRSTPYPEEMQEEDKFDQ